MQAVSPPVVLEGVTRRYGVIAALDRVSVAIDPGQVVGVIGRSGAGKTTLLRCLAGAIPPTEGRVRVGDQELAAITGRALRRHRARVGMIYQQFNLVRRLRVLDNVLVGRLPHLVGWRRWAALAFWFDATERDLAFRCLAHVGLLDRAWQRTDTLSGGQQQRVAIARVLAQGPVLILADEPVASLDVANGAMVMETIRAAATVSGLTVVATLHQVDLARRYCDRILGLHEGQLVFDGRPDELTEAECALVFSAPASPPRLRPSVAAAPAPQWAVL